ncbi:MAG: VWA domain-containing protein [Elusimicrobia bacterium]|nr:VWA domain-containing protein [Elusimicrobiota bacterium]
MDIFAFPKFLWFLVYACLAGMAVIHWIPKKRRRLLSLLISSKHLQSVLSGQTGKELRPVKAVILAVSLPLIAVALAGPQWGLRRREIPLLGANLVVCLDTSDSMLAQDIKPSRFERARFEMIQAFAKGENDAPFRIGLVNFSGRAYLQCPLTLDAGALRFILETTVPGSLPYPGTNINAALKTAAAILERSAGQKNILIVTDGEDHGGDIRSMAGYLQKNKLRVSALWTGAVQGEPIPQRDENGNFLGYKRDKQGNTVVSKAKGDSLEELTRLTGGLFLRLDNNTNPQPQLRSLVVPIDPKKGKGQQMELENRFQIPLALGFLLLLAEFVIPEKKRKTREC